MYIMRTWISFPLLSLAIIFLAGCASIPSLQERQHIAEVLIQKQQWTAENIRAGQFTLRSYRPSEIVSTKILTIYIEGDGLAWIGSETPSGDPTPGDPLALKLALAQPAGIAVYLARPCQYTGAEECKQKYWTYARFSREVVEAMGIAVDQLKSKFSAHQIQLVGYSGGGAVAALLAERRKDVSSLITVAGNLDHAVWTRLHRISPLSASLNPADEALRIKNLSQLHLVGGHDLNMPQSVAQSFTQRGGIVPSAVKIMPAFDHHCCWAAQWANIYAAALL
jgi:dienelactone hydrolase